MISRKIHAFSIVAAATFMFLLPPNTALASTRCGGTTAVDGMNLGIVARLHEKPHMRSLETMAAIRRSRDGAIVGWVALDDAAEPWIQFGADSQQLRRALSGFVINIGSRQMFSPLKATWALPSGYSLESCTFTTQR